jgi:hypothetical protein
MTQKNVDKLSDTAHVKDAARRGYKGEPEPAEPHAPATPAEDESPASVTTVPVGQADASGMKVEKKSRDDAAKAAE